MLKNTALLKTLKQKHGSLTQMPRRYYERMSTEDYLINIRKSMTNTNV